MIQAIIIDDEPHCIEWLSNLLCNEYQDKIEIKATATTVNEGIKQILNLNPDLVFLDVQIGEETGFDLLRQLPERDVEVIFTTAYDQYAIQAIRFSAIDYLMKPIDHVDLSLAINRVSSELLKKTRTDKMSTLLHNLEAKDGKSKKIMVPTSKGYEMLNVADITRCESHINYTTIYLNDHQKILVSKTLKEFEELLSGHNFFRVHNSHLINLSCIKRYHKGKGGSIILFDNTEIEVSTRRKDDLLKLLSTL
jgi:two-component system LytT family response regulator